MHNFKYGDFVYGVSPTSWHIFFHENYAMGMVINVDPLHIILLQFTYQNPKYNFTKSQDYFDTIKKLRRDPQYRHALDDRNHPYHSVITRNVHNANRLRLLTPTLHGMEEARQHLQQLNQDNVLESVNKMMPFPVFAERYLEPQFSPFGPETSL